MLTQRRKGFTLIELLVVIAIIGILASMIFPVFAKAREMAKKAVCLSHVKNIALAANMYMSDWDDMLNPGMVQRDAIDYFGTLGCGPTAQRILDADPYLRPQVVLDEYVGNRDLWRCPSAKMDAGARFILDPFIRTAKGNWLRRIQEAEGGWNGAYMICFGGAWPTGWGGDVTDSAEQQRYALVNRGMWDSWEGDLAFDPTGQKYQVGAKVFITHYSFVSPRSWKLSNSGDPSWSPVVIEHSAQQQFGFAHMLIPDRCHAACWWTACNPEDIEEPVDWGYHYGTPADLWEDCAWSRQCGADWRLADMEFMKKEARHLGGSNIGFADGHAKWFSVGDMLKDAPNRPDGKGRFETPLDQNLKPLAFDKLFR